VGEADNGSAALGLILEKCPDLVLLDLEMPLMGGLEVVRQLKTGPRMPVIVIVTAYDNYAIQAFDAGAVDYLLKPVGQARLAEAVDRARRINQKDAAQKLAQLQEVAEQRASAGGAGPVSSNAARKVVGRIGEEYFLLNASEISAFQADGDIVWIFANKHKYMATQTLKVLEERLSSAAFRRIHRNALVNLDHVRKMSALSSQRWLITLSNAQEFVASKRQARAVREILKW
jgi:two-component system LytT family response regulator